MIFFPRFKALKDSFIIFICVEDIFRRGLPIYTFENLCRQDSSIKLNDRALKYFFIARNCDKILNVQQKALMRLISANRGSDEFTERIARLTETAKKNIQYRRQFMEWERQRAYDFESGKQEGIAEGERQKSVEAALVLVKDFHAPPETAAEKMHAPLEEVLRALNGA